MKSHFYSVKIIFLLLILSSLSSCKLLFNTEPYPPSELDSFVREFKGDSFTDMLMIDEWVECGRVEEYGKEIGSFRVYDSECDITIFEKYASVSSLSQGGHTYIIPTEAAVAFEDYLEKAELYWITLNPKLNFSETDLRLKFYLSGEPKARLKPDEWVEREAPETEGELIAKLNIKFSDEKEDYFLYVYDTYVMVYVEPTREGQYDRVYYALPAESVEAFREYWAERTK